MVVITVIGLLPHNSKRLPPGQPHLSSLSSFCADASYGARLLNVLMATIDPNRNFARISVKNIAGYDLKVSGSPGFQEVIGHISRS